MSKPPYHWIKQIHKAVALTQEIPLYGHPPPFPWDKYVATLAEAWQIPELSISVEETRWRESATLLEGFGKNPTLFTFALTPLEGRALLAVSSEDVAKLCKAGVSRSPNAKGFSDKRLEQGFYAYLLLEALQLTRELKAFGDLSPTLEEGELPQDEGGLCIDLKIQVDKHSLWARLISTEPLCNAFRSHFVQKHAPLPSHIAKSLELPLRFEVGTTTLPLSRWKTIRSGDLLLLDRCSYDPKTRKGSAEIIFGTTPLFRARIKEEGVKILDYAFYFEEERPTMYDEENEDEEEELFPLDDQDDEEEEEENEDDEEEEEESESLDDEDEDEEEEEESLWEPPASPKKSAIQEKISLSDIPLTVTVEVARLHMTMQKLLDIRPGNELELPIHPEQGVQLLINGKPVARGELLKIGESLGVRILQIGE